MPSIRFLLSACLALVLWSPAAACAVGKKQLWDCLLSRGDANDDKRLETEEVRSMVKAHTHWWERLIKSPDSVVNQLEAHCGLPLSYDRLLQPSCFKHCGGLDGRRTVMNRLCPT
tara:strand:+ start:32 stop:376 length:345 start_codon:yes stop_codon:yes gene_type:complete